MIYSTFVAPSERPPSLLQIKRALLTYDRVVVTDPNDRDIIPPQAFTMAMSGGFGIPFAFGGNMGPVRPIGKAANFDADFDQLVEECKEARQQGLFNVISTYPHSNNITLGAVDIGDYPLNPTGMLWLYRSAASENELLLSAIANDSDLLSETDEFIQSIAITQCMADVSVNDRPGSPLIEGEMARPELRETLTAIARSRLAAALKVIGYCTAKEMVPFFSNEFYNRIVGTIVLNANSVIDRVALEDPYWTNRSLALRIAHDEYIDEAVLNEMPLYDVLKLRSTAWGKQAEARESLMKAAADISKQLGHASDFEDRCRKIISQYRTTASELEDERKHLRLRIKCDLGVAASGATVGIAAGSITQIQTAMSAAMVLLIGCGYTLEKIKDYGPLITTLRNLENQVSESAGFGRHQFYQKLPSTIRRESSS